MKENKIHLVPQAVVDCVEHLATTKQDNLRLNYIMRLEAIRDYCDQALKASNVMHMPVKRKSILR